MTSPPRSPGFAPGAAVLLTAAIALGQPAWLTVRGQQPTFRSAVDMIAIDVQVLDREGRPVTTLGPESFDVTLNGQKRRVQYAVFTRYDVMPPPTRTTPALEGVPARLLPMPGARTEPGRTFVIAIDTSSFRTSDAHLAVLAAQRFIDGLRPTDVVSVFTIPFGPRLLPAVDHAAARRALGTIVGRKLEFKSPFEFTPADVIDILAAVEAKPLYQLENDLRRNRRSTFLAGTNEQPFSDEVIAVHCESATDASCLDRVISEATAFAFGLESDAMVSIAGLEELLYLLQESPGKKTVLLLSGGMPLSDRGSGSPSVGNALNKMGEQAAYANATVHAIYFDRNFDDSMSAESRRSRGSSIRSQTIDTKAIAEFARPSGGLLLMSNAGAGEREVARLLAETSTSYVLGVEPDERDRDGRPHRIQVKVKAQGATVRSRQLVVVPRGK